MDRRLKAGRRVLERSLVNVVALASVLSLAVAAEPLPGNLDGTYCETPANCLNLDAFLRATEEYNLRVDRYEHSATQFNKQQEAYHEALAELNSLPPDPWARRGLERLRERQGENLRWLSELNREYDAIERRKVELNAWLARFNAADSLAGGLSDIAVSTELSDEHEETTFGLINPASPVVVGQSSRSGARDWAAQLTRAAYPGWAQPASHEREASNPQQSISRELDMLKKRLSELETARIAHEDATRTIIRTTLSEKGSSINDVVKFGGTIEVLTGWADDFGGVPQSDILLNTAELDFEIQVNHWTLGSLIFEYDDGTNLLFPTTEEDETFVDRINVDTAFITIGDTQKCPLLARVGRMIVPFGISTGDPVADVLTLDDPLTVEVFETKEDALLIGFEIPTPPPPAPSLPKLTTPATAPPGPPPVKPVLLRPIFRQLNRRFCRGLYCNPATTTTTPTTPAITTPPPPPPFNGGIYFYNGDTRNGERDHIEHLGATLGFRTKGVFLQLCLPWSLDIDVDFNSSVFDSRFLEFEYRHFLDQIGYVPGMAAHAKSSLGPVSLVVEWNEAIKEAEFIDDLGSDVNIAPSAWQLALAYQFDWNPSVEVIGAQGTYFTIGYSESRDLAGVTRLIGDEPMRVGFVPKRRFLVSVGEWVLDGLRIAVEYSHVVDYPEQEGGTGHSANGYFAMLTYEW